MESPTPPFSPQRTGMLRRGLDSQGHGARAPLQITTPQLALQDAVATEGLQPAALGHLAAGNPDNRQSIAQARGIDRVVEAMLKHPGDTWVQRNACAVLMHFAEDAE